ncbi:MAG: hypothetical protein QNK03_08005 [Myxococcota bacterium]|nr:hypothetical protein [Myxococcota bacterium]
MTSPTELSQRIDPRAGPPPNATGTALRRVDTAMRFAAGAGWLWIAAGGGRDEASLLWWDAPPFLEPLLRLGLAVCGVASGLGIAPRTSAAAGGLAWLATAPRAVGPLGWIAVAGIAAGRLALHASAAGGWLRRVGRLESERAGALVATGLARASGDGDALRRAGDAYEREGRARGALGAIGAEPSRGLTLLLPVAERLGRILNRSPRLRALLERRS